MMQLQPEAERPETMGKKDQTTSRRSKRLSLVPLRIERSGGVIIALADVDQLLDRWDEAKVSMLMALFCWIDRVSSLDRTHKKLRLLGEETDSVEVLVMCISMMSEGHAFFGKEGLEKHFVEEFQRHPDLRERYEGLRAVLQKRSPTDNRPRYIRNSYGFHMKGFKLVKRGLDHWRRDQGARGVMELFQVRVDSEPHFTAGGCNGVYMAGLYGLDEKASLVDELATAMAELGREAAETHKKIIRFLEALVRAIETDQEDEMAKMQQRSRRP